MQQIDSNSCQQRLYLSLSSKGKDGTMMVPVFDMFVALTLGRTGKKARICKDIFSLGTLHNDFRSLSSNASLCPDAFLKIMELDPLMIPLSLSIAGCRIPGMTSLFALVTTVSKLNLRWKDFEFLVLMQTVHAKKFICQKQERCSVRHLWISGSVLPNYKPVESCVSIWVLCSVWLTWCWPGFGDAVLKHLLWPSRAMAARANKLKVIKEACGWDLSDLNLTK